MGKSLTDVTSIFGRRGFLASLLAGTVLPISSKGDNLPQRLDATQAPVKWQGWKPGEFQIHLIHTGVAESQFLIFPDGTTMLIDCGDHAAITRLEKAVKVVPNPSRLAGEWIARYIQRVNPNGNNVDYIEASHWHSDHTGYVGWQSQSRSWKDAVPGCWRSGFALAAELLHFRKAIDRGFPDYKDPIPFVDGESRTLEHMRRLYKALAVRDGLKVEKFRLGARDQVVPIRGKVSGFDVFNLCSNGKVSMPDGSVLNVYADQFEGGKVPGWLNENGMSLGHIFTYGKFRYFTAGDFSDHLKTPTGKRMIEDDLAKAVGKVAVAKLNHHGHYSMPPSLIRALQPLAWVACVWDQYHVVPNVLERLGNPVFYRSRKPAMIFPGTFPEPRATVERSAEYFKYVAPECCGDGCHNVITVPPGGESFTISCIDASDEEMNVKGVYRFAL